MKKRISKLEEDKMHIKGTGTKEWADSNVNIAYGCSHDCRYCYAKKMAIRFKRIKEEEEWRKMNLNKKAIQKGYAKRQGRIMFPSSHDITPQILDPSIKVLKKLLNAGNEVLITSKPHFECIEKICREFQEYKEQIQFRFTITSMYNKILEFWEPNAPQYEERRDALEYAFLDGYKTSVSCEPYLDDPSDLYFALRKFITESFWIGKMNYISRDLPEPWQSKIRQLYKNENIIELYLGGRDLPKIRWKDSIKKIINQRLEKEEDG
jgi:DNA repair photolyase